MTTAELIAADELLQTDTPAAPIEGELVIKNEVLDGTRNAVAEMDKIRAGLAQLKELYEGVVYEVTTTEGDKAAREARMALRAVASRLEAARKAGKRKIIDLGKQVDKTAEDVDAELTSLIEPIHAQIKAEEDRVAAEKLAKAETERLAREAIQKRISAFSLLPSDNIGRTSIELKVSIDNARAQLATVGNDDTFGEWKATAVMQLNNAILRLEAMQEAAVAQEAEAIRVQQLQEQLAAERKQREEQEAERERLAALERIRVREEQELAGARVSEISGIQQQAIIAAIGRAGVRQGGTIQCAQETLEETQAWEVTERKFGPLFGTASNAKTLAIAAIEGLLVTLRQRAADDAEREKQETARREEARAEREKLRKEREDADKAKLDEQERNAAAQRDIAEQQKAIDDRQVELNAEAQRQQDARDQAERDRLAAEAKAAAPAPAPVLKPLGEGPLRGELDLGSATAPPAVRKLQRPSDSTLVDILADHLDVDDTQILEWIPALDTYRVVRA